VRDLDVALGRLRRELEGLDETDQRAKALILERLEEERERRRRLLLEVFDSAEYRFVLGRLRVPPRLAGRVEEVPLGSIAEREFRRLARLAARLGKQPDEGAIHRLGPVLERVRHAAELAAPVEAVRRRALAESHVLQGLIREHRESLVAEQRLRGAVVEDVRTAAAFAAGRLAERQRRRRELVQERLPSAWRRLRESVSG
jgi:CHAD domain-containing protein